MMEKRADIEECDGFRMCTCQSFKADIPGRVHGLLVVVGFVDDILRLLQDFSAIRAEHGQISFECARRVDLKVCRCLDDPESEVIELLYAR